MTKPVISMVGCRVEMHIIGVISRWIEFSWDVLSLVYRVVPLQYILCAIKLYGFWYCNTMQECFQLSHTDWRLDKMTSSYVEDSTPWDDIVASINNVGSSAEDGPPQYSLQLVVEISRNTKILEKLFYVPLIRMIFLHFFEYLTRILFYFFISNNFTIL